MLFKLKFILSNLQSTDEYFGHVKVVFSLITIIFIVCVLATLTSYAEIPLDTLETLSNEKPKCLQSNSDFPYDMDPESDNSNRNQGSLYQVISSST